MSSCAAASILPLLRSAAPRLTRRFFFTCRDCSRKPFTPHPQPCPLLARPPFKSKRDSPFLQAFRSKSTKLPANGRKPPSQSAELAKQSSPKTSPTGTNTRAPPNASRAIPAVSHRAVALWLLGSAASVYGIVVFGALTRLTESGLSITEWRPITGTLPPLSLPDWELEFSKYRASPEFQKLNPNMNLSEFKQIFWMEYIHRLWGRVIGLSFLLPTIYFIARRRVTTSMARNLLLINCLIGLQGFVGWWMVKSGLKDDLFAKDAHPRVSQYRLATHLGLAFTVYISMLWNGLSILRERRLIAHSEAPTSEKLLSRLSSSALRPFRFGVFAVALLIGTTAVSGALVAGLDAGLIYNEFPYMGLGLTPPRAELWSAFYSRQAPPHADLWWRNMLENPSLVQLEHRILAVSTFTAVHALFLYARFTPAVRARLPTGAKTALSGGLIFVWAQVALGISTLVYLVPTSLAATHQAGSLALLTSVVLLGSRVWTPARLARLVREKAAEVRRLPKQSARVAGGGNQLADKKGAAAAVHQANLKPS